MKPFLYLNENRSNIVFENRHIFYITCIETVLISKLKPFPYLWWLVWYTLRVALSIAITQPISLSPFRLVDL
jgi:hypothetical protein